MTDHVPSSIWDKGGDTVKPGIWQDQHEGGRREGQLVRVKTINDGMVTFANLTAHGAETREYTVPAGDFDGWMTDSSGTDHRWHRFIADEYDPVALRDVGVWPARRFVLNRDTDITGISGTGIVADGVVWPDGTVSIRWRGERPSVVFWERLDDAEAIHGHGGATRFVWVD